MRTVILPLWLVWVVPSALVLIIFFLLVWRIIVMYRALEMVSEVNGTIDMMRERYYRPVYNMMSFASNEHKYVDHKGRRINFGDTLRASDAIGNEMILTADFNYFEHNGCMMPNLNSPMMFWTTNGSRFSYEELMSRFNKVLVDKKYSKKHNALDGMITEAKNPCPPPAWLLAVSYEMVASALIINGYRRSAFCSTLEIVKRSRTHGVASPACRFFEKRVCGGERVTDENYDRLLDECCHRELMLSVTGNEMQDDD